MKKMRLVKMSGVMLILLALLTVGNQATKEAKAESVQTSNLIIKNFNSSNGLATSEANTVLCSKTGHIWVGSYGGLLRYDGNSFYNYSKDPSFKISGIKYLCEDDNGTLFIATNGDGIYSFSNNQFNEVKTSDGKSIPTCTVLTKDNNNNIYAGCNSEAFKITNGVAYKVSNGTMYSTVYNLTVDDKNNIWGNDYNGALFKINNGQQIAINTPAEIDSSLFDLGNWESVYSVVYHKNSLYLGTSLSQVIKVEFTTDENNALVSNRTAISTAPLKEINRMAFDNDDNLWLAAGNGCGYLDTLNNLITDDELQDISRANDVTIDYQNNVWFASQNNGLYEASAGSYSHVINATNIKNNQVNSVVFANDHYFVGTEKGLVITDKFFKEESYSITSSLSGLRVRNINLDSENNIWIATEKAGDCSFVKLNPASPTMDFVKCTKLTAETNKPRISIELSDGNLAVGTADGVAIIDKENANDPIWKKKADGLTNSTILSLAESSNGELLIGTDGEGLFKLKDDVISPVLYGSEKLSHIMKMFKDSDTTWVSSVNRLFKYKDGVLSEINASLLDSLSILDMHCSGDKFMIFKSDGIYMLNKNEVKSNSISSYTIFDSKQGLIGDVSSNSFSLVNDGKIYLCTTKGLATLSLDATAKIKVQPKLTINKISYEINGKNTVKTGNFDKIEVPQSASRIRIEFSCLNYSIEDVYVCYKLEGYDKEATELLGKGTNEAVYSSLPGGDYQFKLYLKEVGDNSNSNLSLSFNKIYRWKEKTANIVFVAIGSFLLVVGIAALIAFLRLRKAEAEKMKYKEITNEALNTIANTIDAKDEYTNGHSQRVAQYSVEIGKRLGMSEEELENLHYVALLHDIGKIGVPDAILNKPGKLNDEEYAAIQKHTVIGGKILHDFKMIENIADGAIGHHERYDGKGYPNHKVGEENPLIARIISVADTYDAMSSTRPYRTGRTPEFCIEQIEQGKGTQFDPALADIMIEIIKENSEKSEK